MLVVEHPALPRAKTPWTKSRDVWWGDEVARQKAECTVEWLDADAPAFLLYTSGSTGKPKGVQHSIGKLALLRLCVNAAVLTERKISFCWPICEVDHIEVNERRWLHGRSGNHSQVRL